MKGCSLDLHRRVFGPEHCAQTPLARSEVNDHRSFARDTWVRLEDATREYGVTVSPD